MLLIALPACHTTCPPTEIWSPASRGSTTDAAVSGGAVMVMLSVPAAAVVHDTAILPCGVGTVPFAHCTELVSGETEKVENPGPVGCTPSTRVERY